jgi:hypothetical protein
MIALNSVMNNKRSRAMKIHHLNYLVLIILLSFFSESYSQKKNFKSLFSTMICSEEYSYETFDGGLSYQLFLHNRNSYFIDTDTNERTDNNVLLSNMAQIAFYPNPVRDLIKMSIESSQTSSIKLTILDELNNSKILLQQEITEGNHIFDIELSTSRRGLNLLFLEINGNITVHKIFKE